MGRLKTLRIASTTGLTASIGIVAVNRVTDIAKNLCQLTGPDTSDATKWCLANIAPWVGDQAWLLVAALALLAFFSWFPEWWPWKKNSSKPLINSAVLSVSPVVRDVWLLNAIHYVAFGSWQLKEWESLSGNIGKLSDASDKIRQRARDGDLPIWGSRSGSQVLNPIDAEFWAYHGIEWFSLLKGETEELTTELKEVGYRSLVERQVRLMTSRTKVEELWPSGNISA